MHRKRARFTCFRVHDVDVPAVQMTGLGCAFTRWPPSYMADHPALTDSVTQSSGLRALGVVILAKVHHHSLRQAGKQLAVSVLTNYGTKYTLCMHHTDCGPPRSDWRGKVDNDTPRK